MIHNKLAVVTLVAALVLSASASAGFSSESGERDLGVKVVGDEEAFLGLAWHSLERCGDQSLVEIKNQFKTGLSEIEVSVTDTDRLETEIRDFPENLGPGESATIRIRLNPVEANQTDERWVEVSVEASGPDVEVGELHRRLTVSNCPTRGGSSGGNTEDGS